MRRTRALDPARTWGLSFLLTCVAWTAAWAHQVHHEVTTSEAVVIVLDYADGTAFAFEECEIRRADTGEMLLLGRTDASGRLAFVPPEPGRYAVRALTEDGHGARFEFDSTSLPASKATIAGAGDRSRGALQIATGVALILALFALLRRFTRSSDEGTPR